MAPPFGRRRRTTSRRCPSKQIQEKPRKNACMSLVFFGRIWTFQWVTREKIKKFCLASTRSPGCSFKRLTRVLSLPCLLVAGPCRPHWIGGVPGKCIAQLPGFGKLLPSARRHPNGTKKTSMAGTRLSEPREDLLPRLEPDEIGLIADVIARSRRALSDARLSTSYGDAAIQGRRARRLLDCFASLAMTALRRPEVIPLWRPPSSISAG